MQAELAWINNVRLPWREGLLQIEFQQGKIARVAPQPENIAGGAALNAEGGLAFPPLLNRISILIPLRRREKRRGTRPAPCLKGLSAGQSVMRC